MARHRALTEPTFPVAERTPSTLNAAGMRPRRVQIIDGPSGSSLMTARESYRARGPRTTKPAFPPLRKHSTSDHIDTVVLDPDADEDNEDSNDDNGIEEGEEDDEQEEVEGAEDDSREEDRRQQQNYTDRDGRDGSSSSSRGSGSGQTLSEEPLAIARREKSPTDGRQKLNEKQDLNRAEKGQAAGPALEGVRRRTISRITSGKTRKNPETREWKDNVSGMSCLASRSMPQRDFALLYVLILIDCNIKQIITFDSPDDPMNPKNWLVFCLGNKIRALD
jgi:hypothetical protein